MFLLQSLEVSNTTEKNESCPRSAKNTALALWQAIAEGFIIPLNEGYKFIVLDVDGLEDELEVNYKFAHDRIQQAVYSLIPEKHFACDRESSPRRTEVVELTEVLNR